MRADARAYGSSLSLAGGRKDICSEMSLYIPPVASSDRPPQQVADGKSARCFFQAPSPEPPSAGGMGEWSAPVPAPYCPSGLLRLSIIWRALVRQRPGGRGQASRSAPAWTGCCAQAPLEHLGCATQRKIESGAPVVRQGNNDHFPRSIVQFDLAALVHPAPWPIHVGKPHFEAGDRCGEAAKGKPCAFNGQLSQLAGLMMAGLENNLHGVIPFWVSTMAPEQIGNRSSKSR